MKFPNLPMLQSSGQHIPNGPDENLWNEMAVELKNCGYSAYRLGEEVRRFGPFNEVELILFGNSEVTSGGKRTELKSPSVHLFSLGQEATITNLPGLKKIHFQCALRVGASDLMLGERPLSKPLPGNPHHWWGRARHVIDQKDILGTKALLFEALSILRSELSVVAERKHSGLTPFQGFFEYVASTKVSEFSLEAVAGQHRLTPGYFSKIFKERHGVTAKQFFLSEVTRRAKTLLTEKESRLAHIAETLGFCDAFHFSRTFQHQTGMSPRDYRRKYTPARPSGH